MTVTVYGLDCGSTRKTKQWLEKIGVPFVERNILKEPLTVSELQGILRMTLDGTEGIVATRSKAYKDLDLDIDELSLQELMELIQQHPRLLRSPIIVDEKRLQAGYQEDEIRQFLPRKTRKTQWLNWSMNHLPLMES
ncbi:transcriptional regulator Spx [Niallia endozanthoxylica]|uniref:Spx/MgsR family RNA polymerase-binding regulatory protein n=1 Tax=Niallia endozanthoxylica TaxID=2036016 RepID=A0A5J5HN33_9BACI|nr:transcriptional regulator Spx [Niallia endozanthoxylica]KAA9022862.1 Spx/MgsR family RNA polymerase-binding regulatory protein [Niallia endozanthoxylica]